jgi:nucleotide-binding universal stress UspA family protein
MSGNTPEGEHLRQALAVLTGLGVPAVARVRHGLIIDEILAEVHEGNHDLLVVGTQSADGWMRFLVNDLGQQIIGCTDRPILVAKT